MGGQTQQETMNDSSGNSNTDRNINRYQTMANDAASINANNRVKLNKNERKLQKNIVTLGSNAVTSQLRLTNLVEKQGSKLSKKILDNKIITNTVKGMVMKHFSGIPGIGGSFTRNGRRSRSRSRRSRSRRSRSRRSRRSKKTMRRSSMQQSRTRKLHRR